MPTKSSALTTTDAVPFATIRFKGVRVRISRDYLYCEKISHADIMHIDELNGGPGRRALPYFELALHKRIRRACNRGSSIEENPFGHCPNCPPPFDLTCAFSNIRQFGSSTVEFGMVAQRLLIDRKISGGVHATESAWRLTNVLFDVILADSPQMQALITSAHPQPEVLSR